MAEGLVLTAPSGYVWVDTGARGTLGHLRSIRTAPAAGTTLCDTVQRLGPTAPTIDDSRACAICWDIVVVRRQIQADRLAIGGHAKKRSRE